MNSVVIGLFMITAVTLITSLIKDISYNRERKDLLNRIMAKDLGDYRSTENNNLPKGRSPLKNANEFKGFYE